VPERRQDREPDAPAGPGSRLGGEDPGAVLAREASSLVQRLRTWAPTRWAAAAPEIGSRADVVHHLAQRLADDAARLEGRPPRALPRLETDLVLPDQLAVTADDLVRAAPPAELALASVAHLLLHRRSLLGEDPPAALADLLGGDPDGAGRRACAG
jgi:hypothetical protein